MVSGYGIIDCQVENAGILDVRERINIHSDYIGTPNSRMKIGWAPDTDGAFQADSSRLSVLGVAKLSGTLEIGPKIQKTLRTKRSIEILRANTVEGRFDNPDNIVETADGKRFQIRYTSDSVLLESILKESDSR